MVWVVPPSAGVTEMVNVPVWAEFHSSNAVTKSITDAPPVSESFGVRPLKPVPVICQGADATPLPVTVTLSPVRALSAAATCAAVAL